MGRRNNIIRIGEIQFEVISAGDTNIYAEIVKNDCNNGKTINVDFINPCEKTEEDTSEINLNFEDGILTISGHGRVINNIEEYDVNKVIPEDKSLINSIVVEEGINRIGSNYTWSYDFSELEEIWFPKSIEYTAWPHPYMNKDIIVHGYGMSNVEKLLSEYDSNIKLYDSEIIFALNEGFMVGDLDSDGIFNANDALGLLRMAAKLDPLYKWSGDADGNGTVNASDALWVLKRAAKVE